MFLYVNHTLLDVGIECQVIVGVERDKSCQVTTPYKTSYSRACLTLHVMFLACQLTNSIIGSVRYAREQEERLAAGIQFQCQDGGRRGVPTGIERYFPLLRES